MRIEVEVTHGEALLTIRGVIDRSMCDVAAGLAGLGRGCRAVVVDLRDAVLASPHGVQDMVAALRQQARTADIALVCDRLPGRRLLRLACGSSGVRVLDRLPAGGGRSSGHGGRPGPTRPRVPAPPEAGVAEAV